MEGEERLSGVWWGWWGCCWTYGDLIGHVVLPEDIAFDYARLPAFRDIADTGGQDCIAVVCSTVSG